jgi:hypothetical protein
MSNATAVDQRRVTVPTGELDGAEVRKIQVGRDLGNLRMAMSGRSTKPGEYTALYVDGRLWMSDTDAEYSDHLPAIREIRREHTSRVLINGLGIGMVVQAALNCEHVERIDIVEFDQRVIDLVGPHYTRDPRVTIHQADAYTIKWDREANWDVAWHDIWADLCTDSLPLMTKLHRKYGKRVRWQGSWGKELLKAQQRRESSWRW